jgi:hypothetical protein
MTTRLWKSLYSTEGFTECTRKGSWVPCSSHGQSNSKVSTPLPVLKRRICRTQLPLSLFELATAHCSRAMHRPALLTLICHIGMTWGEGEKDFLTVTLLNNVSNTFARTNVTVVAAMVMEEWYTDCRLCASADRRGSSSTLTARRTASPASRTYWFNTRSLNGSWKTTRLLSYTYTFKAKWTKLDTHTTNCNTSDGARTWRQSAH